MALLVLREPPVVLLVLLLAADVTMCVDAVVGVADAPLQLPLLLLLLLLPPPQPPALSLVPVKRVNYNYEILFNEKFNYKSII